MSAEPVFARELVCGVDGSPQSRRAAHWAAALADRCGARLCLVHALGLRPAVLGGGPPGGRYRERRHADAGELLAAERRELLEHFPHLWITMRVEDTDAVRTLIAYGDQAEITVAGLRGAGGFAGLPIGSTGARLAAHCRRPLILVPADRAEPRAPARILLGVEADESGPAGSAALTGYREQRPGSLSRPEQPEHAARFAVELARATGAELSFVHAWEPDVAAGGEYPAEPALVAALAEELLAHTVKRALDDARAELAVNTRVVRGHPARVLRDAAAGADLLVLGAHRGRAAYSLGLGPVLHALLQRPPCPLAVVPPGVG